MVNLGLKSFILSVKWIVVDYWSPEVINMPNTNWVSLIISSGLLKYGSRTWKYGGIWNFKLLMSYNDLQLHGKWYGYCKLSTIWKWKQERNIKGQGKDVRNYSWKLSQLYKYYVLEILSICLI